MIRRSLALLGILASLTVAVVVPAGPAAAHTPRCRVGFDGPYADYLSPRGSVQFSCETTYQGWIQVRLTDGNGHVYNTVSGPPRGYAWRTHIDHSYCNVGDQFVIEVDATVWLGADSTSFTAQSAPGYCTF